MASLTEEERAIDPYRVLGIEVTATEQQVKKAYRKRSLKCHPDKNPTPEAAQEFHRISIALAILTDPGKRAFLDKKLEQTRAAEARRAEMDAKRKDLLRREEEAKRARTAAQDAIRQKAKEEEIREAGKRLLEERRAQAAAMRANTAHTSHPPAASAKHLAPPPISPEDLTILLVVSAPPPNAEELRKQLGTKYGKIADVFVSAPKEGKKKVRAVVEFAPGNWGGCWSCLRDAGGIKGAKAKWVGAEPAWVKWAAAQDGTNSLSPPTGDRTHAPSPPSHTGTPAAAPSTRFGSGAFGSAPDHFASVTMFPDIADLTASHRQRAQDERTAHAELASAQESATLLRMRQREKERQDMERRIRQEEGDE
ncbi:hypothetical protein A1Q1_06740 [Trichosporon asahii var. asahii CBS 2479]|uniref:J domain-containing protein n=1 Tax=Trichosporon asahii var. asahii (strain ATCC 90039 / CBS 2479 / JCM 2466 / KCTC 7840 / NBRC 103889/ NCYC 2677 / UAMH 7654) TaxID=1186058 RepID=J6F9X4_TRIAS|nr:hypothetical protein A1Q1_06740 [Trichosporon asahii var. asahii CBS 2479]EJT52027.1 hypothetical protein A1Q1_06740 [Trichosporon asahii var. asahii CBS 2479]